MSNKNKPFNHSQIDKQTYDSNGTNKPISTIPGLLWRRTGAPQAAAAPRAAVGDALFRLVLTVQFFTAVEAERCQKNHEKVEVWRLLFS